MDPNESQYAMDEVRLGSQEEDQKKYRACQ